MGARFNTKGSAGIGILLGDLDLNERLEAIEDAYEQITTWESVSTTTGTITAYEGTAVVEDFAYGGSFNAACFELEAGRPTDTVATDATGRAVTATIDAGGNYTIHETPETTPVALVWDIIGRKKSTATIPQAKIIQSIEVNSAIGTRYDNTGSGLTSVTAQGAIDEIDEKVDNALSDLEIDMTNAIFVDNSGNDSTGDGSISNPYQTITKSITEATAGQTIVSLGENTFEEDVTGVDGISIFAPNSTLLLNDGDQLAMLSGQYRFKSIERTSGTGYMIVAQNVSAYCNLIVEDIRDAGSGDTVSANNGTLFKLDFSEAYLLNGGVFYTDNSSSNHTHLLGQDIYLQSANCTAIKLASGGDLLMSVQHIKETSSGVGNGLAFDVDNGSIQTNIQEIVVTQLADIEADGVLNLSAQKASGTVTNDNGVYNYMLNEIGGSFELGSSLVANIDAQAYKLKGLSASAGSFLTIGTDGLLVPANINSGSTPTTWEDITPAFTDVSTTTEEVVYTVTVDEEFDTGSVEYSLNVEFPYYRTSTVRLKKNGVILDTQSVATGSSPVNFSGAVPINSTVNNGDIFTLTFETDVAPTWEPNRTDIIDGNLLVTKTGESITAEWGSITGSISSQTDLFTTFLSKTNTDVYTPTDNYHPATKKYIDDEISSFSIEFTGLTDTPSSYTNANSLYSVNGTTDGITELSTTLTEGTNQFVITNGTSAFTVSNTATIDQDLSTTSDVQFNNITLSSGTSVNEFSIDGTLAGNSDDAVPTEKAVKTYVDSAAGTSAYPSGHLFGLEISNNSTDSSHDIDISTGTCRDSADSQNISLSSALTKQIDVNWSAGNNSGGFPSGLSLSASTWYHVFVIYNPTTDTVDAGFDTSLTASNLLSDATGYTKYRRVGSVLTDSSSNIYGFVQFGDRFMWKAFKSELSLSGQSSSISDTTLTVTTPLGVISRPILRASIGDSGTASILVLILKTIDVGFSAFIAVMDVSEIEITDITLTNTSSQIIYSTLAGGGTPNYYLNLESFGYIDTRGRE